MSKPSRSKPVTRRHPLAGLRFVLEGLIIRGLKFRLMLAAMIVVAVAVVAGVMVAVLDGGFSGAGDAVWWAFLRLTDPGYLGDDEGFAKRSISTAVTVLGYILFLGLLIAILTQWLNKTIEKLETGVTPVVLSDHVVILGWTHQTPAIVESLLRTGPRVERFLADRGKRNLRIVIMVERIDEAFRQKLRELLGKKVIGRRVFVRTGTPLHVNHLERVAYRDAAVVILPGSGFAERNPDYVDSRSIKTLASVSRFASESGTEPPLAVAELFDARRVDVANKAYDGASEVIAADAIVSRLIAQSVRRSGLWSVMSELFMLNEGNAIYLRRLEGQAGVRFRDIRERFSSAILMGFVRPAERRPMLNPDPESILEADDLLVFLAHEFESCVPDSEGTAQWASTTTAEKLRPPADGIHRVLILGWSRKVPTLVRELGRFGDDAFEVDIVSRTPIEVREAGLARDASSTSQAKVRQIHAGFSLPGVLESLEPEKYNNIIVLASELLEEKEQADAISVVAALTLRGVFKERNQRPEVLVELLDQENQHLFRGCPEDVMISPTVVSYVVSQVALRRALAWVFWELSSPLGGQIVLRKAKGYLGTDGSVRFGDVQRAAAAHGEIALGFRRPTEAENGLGLNPDRKIEWSIEPDDEVVVLTRIKEPE